MGDARYVFDRIQVTSAHCSEHAWIPTAPIASTAAGTVCAATSEASLPDLDERLLRQMSSIAIGPVTLTQTVDDDGKTGERIAPWQASLDPGSKGTGTSAARVQGTTNPHQVCRCFTRDRLSPTAAKQCPMSAEPYGIEYIGGSRTR